MGNLLRGQSSALFGVLRSALPRHRNHDRRQHGGNLLGITMTIDAQVRSVFLNEDGSGVLNLMDRPSRPGSYEGIKGQPGLHFSRSPEEVTALNGVHISGNETILIVAGIEIAKVVGHGQIVFADRDTFNKAIGEYWRKKKRKTA